MAKKAKKAAKKAAPAKKTAAKKPASKPAAKAKSAPKVAKSAPKKAAAEAAKKVVKKAAKKTVAKKIVKKVAPTAKKPAKKTVKKPDSKPTTAAKKSVTKGAKKARTGVSSPRVVAASRTPPKSARPPKSQKGGRGGAEVEVKRPTVVRPRGKGKAGALHGLLVLDLTTDVAGRVATQMLANFGAEVTKIEPVGAAGADDSSLGSPPDAAAALYTFLNRGKKSVALNLKKAAAKAAFLQMVKRADVVIEGHRPGRMESLGVGYKTLKNHNKRLVYVSLTGFGQTGPLAKTVGHDLNYVALSGVLELMSGEHGAPLMPGLQLSDIAAGALPAVIGVLLALAARDRTGVGQQVDVALYDGLIGLLIPQLAQYSVSRRTPQRGKEKLFGQFACYNVYPVRNGRWMSVAALEPAYWKNLCEAIDRADLIEDQYSSGDRQQVLIAELTRVFQKKEVSEWLEFFAEEDACVAPVRHLGDTLRDEHLIDRETIVQVRSDDGSAYPHVGVYPKLSETPGSLGDAPPARGRDSLEILEGLGLSQKKIKDMLRSGATEAPE